MVSEVRKQEQKDIFPIEKRLRSRILDELHRHRELTTKQEYVDEVLARTVEAMEGYVNSLADEIRVQQAALAHRKEEAELRQQLISDQVTTSRLQIDLTEVFFRTDVELMVKHFQLAEKDALEKAFGQLSEETVVCILEALLAALSDKQMEQFILKATGNNDG